MPIKLPPKFGTEPIYNMLSIQDLLDLPAPVYLVDGLIPENAVCLLTGIKGTYKSFFALDIGLTMSHGIGNFHGHSAQSGGVVYFAGEGGGGFGQRVYAWRQYHKYEKQHISPFWLVRDPMSILNDDDVDKVVRTIKQAEDSYNCQFRLMITDTMSRAFQGQKEDEQNWGKAILMSERIKEKVGHGMSFLGVAHEGKEDGRGTRGSSVADCNADAILRMSQPNKSGRPDELKLFVEKLKDDADGQMFNYVTCNQTWTRHDTGQNQSSVVLLSENEETDPQKLVRHADRAERLKNNPPKANTREEKHNGKLEDLRKRIASLPLGIFTISHVVGMLGASKGRFNDDIKEAVDTVMTRIDIGEGRSRTIQRTGSEASGWTITIALYDQ